MIKKLCIALIILLCLPIGRSFAAINFNGVNQNLSSTTVPFTAAPFTVCLWFRSEDDTANKVTFSVAVSGADTDDFEMQVSGAEAGDPVRFFIRASSSAINLATTTGITINTYHSACIVEASATDHKVYIDGNSVGSSTTSRVPSGLNRLEIADRAGSANSPFDGDIAEVAVWSTALSAGDISSLHSNAYEATCIQQGSLTHYWKLTDNTDLTDSVSSVVLTANNSPTSSTHPTINSCATITPGVLDTFTGANGTELTAHNATWVDVYGGVGEIQGNQFAKAASATAVYHWNETMPSADGRVIWNIIAEGTGTGRAHCVFGRMSTNVINTRTGYAACITWDFSAGQERISVERVDTSESFVVIDSVLENLSPPFDLELKMQGTTISAYIGGVLKAQATDATYSAAGRIGIWMGSD